MDFIGTTERVLTAMRQLLSFITPQLSSGNGDTFIEKVYSFVQKAIFTLQQMEASQKKQWNLLLTYILSTASLVLKLMSSNVAFDAVTRVSREVQSTFDGRIPEYIARDYDDLQRNLSTASEKLEAIQSSCDWLIGEVTKACESPWTNPLNFRRLKACHLKASVDIRDCEQSVNSAHEIIELLQRKTSEELVKLGLGLGFFAAFAAGLGFGAVKAIHEGAKLKGGILGFLGVGGALACVVIAKKFSDYMVVWEDVRNKRSQYRQLSSRLESLKETFERDLKAGIQLTSMPNLAMIVSLAFLVAFGGILFAYNLVK